MKINNKFNFVFNIETGSAADIVAFHTPISEDIFEQFYDIIGKVKAQISAQGMTYMGQIGPRISRLALIDQARKIAAENGDFNSDGKGSADAAMALLGELTRLTMLAVPSGEGFNKLPVQVAISQGILPQELWDEALGELVFFTALLFTARLRDRMTIAEAAASLLEGAVTLLDFTAHLNSLPKSTEMNHTLEVTAA